MDLSQEKGASNWLTVLPVKEYGFSLHKGAFRDTLALRYGWKLPQHVPVCPKFSVEPTLSCAKGGYPSIRHNEIQDLTAHLMTEVCPNVALEPHLQPLTGERFSETTARIQPRLDEAADGFWGSRFERSLFDVRDFNPYAPLSRRLQLPAACYRTHKNIKRGHMTNESGR